MTSLPRLTVVGTGYLGITHAACMASQGFQVLGVDTDAEKIARLSAAEVPVFEPGLENLLREGLESSRLCFTTSYEHAASFGDVHFICVGTPQRRDGNGADLAQLDACIAGLAPQLKRPCLIVGKSTTPAGTAAMAAARIARLAPAGRFAEVCWNPEFLREGHAVEDTLAPSRIVLGVTSPHAEAVMRVIYAPQLAAGAPLYVTDLHTAELAKAAANAFLATKISFINAIAEACEEAGADIRVLARILGDDPRIGAAYLSPGLGFGGGCLPKDIRAFKTQARQLGAEGLARLLGEVDAINLQRRAWVASLACEVAGGSLAGKAVCVLGAAFKPGSDDVRDSPALDVAQMLHAMGGRVTVYDPAALDNARKACPQLRYAGSVRAAAADAQVVLVLTDWPEFSRIDPAELGEVSGVRRGVIDARHALDPQLWRAAGWDYRAPGVPAAPSRPPSAGTPRPREPATSMDLRALLGRPIEGAADQVKQSRRAWPAYALAPGISGNQLIGSSRNPLSRNRSEGRPTRRAFTHRRRDQPPIGCASILAGADANSRTRSATRCQSNSAPRRIAALAKSRRSTWSFIKRVSRPARSSSAPGT